MPQLFDLPRAALQTYTGSTPRPDDHDDYWTQALAELSTVDPDVSIEPAEFAGADFAVCSDLWFTGTHDARVHARLWRPSRIVAPTPTLLVYHGLSGRAPDWTTPLGYVAAGWTVLALDCRGQGGPSQDLGGAGGWTLRGFLLRGLIDDPRQAYYRQVFLDAVRLAQVALDLPDVDPTRLAATGKSQGGGLTLAAAALEPRISRAAPVFPYLCDYRRVWDLDLAVDAYADLREWFRGVDPTRRREDEVFTKLGYLDVVHLAPRITAEVLMTIGLSDRICPPSTQFAAYNAITSPKSTLEYPDFGHEALPGHEDDIWSFLLGTGARS